MFTVRDDPTLRDLFVRWTMVKISYLDPINIAQEVTEICVSQGKWRQLELFFHELVRTYPRIFEDLYKDEKFILNVIAYHRYKGNYLEIYRLIEEGTFTNLSAMVELWDELHYEEKRNGAERLSAVARFRIRKKNPPPPSICPTGCRPTSSLPKEATKILRDWMEQHKSFPYPNKKEKAQLCYETGLSMLQVQTWFANTRRRSKLSKRRKSKKDTCTKPILASEIKIHNKEYAAIEGMLALGRKINYVPSNLKLSPQINNFSEGTTIPLDVSSTQQYLNNCQQETNSELIHYGINESSYHLLTPMNINLTTLQPGNKVFPCYEGTNNGVDIKNNSYIYVQADGIVDKDLLENDYTNQCETSIGNENMS